LLEDALDFRAQIAGERPLNALQTIGSGCAFLDADADGNLDVLMIARKPTLFRGDGAGKFAAALARPLVGRGLAVGDFDNDGRQDVLIGDIEGEPLLLRNESPARSWVGFSLEGTKSNRRGLGARVSVTAGGRVYVRHCHTDGSYLSASDPRVHFGLGAATAIEKVTIQWPSGKTQTLDGVTLNRYHRVTETP
jgi:hypothetical protein